MAASRRSAAGGDNILARLERQDSGVRARWPRAVIAASAIGVVLSASLVAALLGLSGDNLQVHRPQPAASSPAVAAATPPLAAPAPDFADQAAASAAMAPAAPAAALNQAAPPRQATAASDLAAIGAAPATAPRSAPPQQAVATRQAATAKPGNRSKPARNGSRARIVDSLREVRSAHAGDSAKIKSGNLRPRDAIDEATLDGDVALLSAILLHAPRHSAERARAAATCNKDKKCTSAPLPALLDIGE